MSCSAIVPHDLLRIMENEYSDMCLGVIEIICNHYQLDITQVKNVINKKTGMTFVIDETKNNYKLVRRKPSKPSLDSACRCIANLFDFQTRTARRCVHARKKEDDLEFNLFCSVHNRMFRTDRLAYGIDKSCQEEYDAAIGRMSKPIHEVKTKDAFISLRKKENSDASRGEKPPVLLKKQVIKKLK